MEICSRVRAIKTLNMNIGQNNDTLHDETLLRNIDEIDVDLLKVASQGESRSHGKLDHMEK